MNFFVLSLLRLHLQLRSSFLFYLEIEYLRVNANMT